MFRGPKTLPCTSACFWRFSQLYCGKCGNKKLGTVAGAAPARSPCRSVGPAHAFFSPIQSEAAADIPHRTETSQAPTAPKNVRFSKKVDPKTGQGAIFSHSENCLKAVENKRLP